MIFWNIVLFNDRLYRSSLALESRSIDIIDIKMAVIIPNLIHKYNFYELPSGLFKKFTDFRASRKYQDDELGVVKF